MNTICKDCLDEMDNGMLKPDCTFINRDAVHDCRSFQLQELALQQEGQSESEVK